MLEVLVKGDTRKSTGGVERRSIGRHFSSELQRNSRPLAWETWVSLLRR
jgi:hypothetical protein